MNLFSTNVNLSGENEVLLKTIFSNPPALILLFRHSFRTVDFRNLKDERKVYSLCILAP